jgi:hypothetical protein
MTPPLLEAAAPQQAAGLHRWLQHRWSFSLLLVSTRRQLSIFGRCMTYALLLPQLHAATTACCHVQVCRMISNPKVTSDITRRMAACYGDRKQKEVGVLRRLVVVLLAPSACSYDDRALPIAVVQPSMCLHSSAL